MNNSPRLIVHPKLAILPKTIIQRGKHRTPNNEVNQLLRNASFCIRYSIFFKNHVNLITLGVSNKKIIQ